MFRSWCVDCDKELPPEDQHVFAGYGYYAVYCAACCPRSMDGTDCDMDHEDEQAKK